MLAGTALVLCGCGGAGEVEAGSAVSGEIMEVEPESDDGVGGLVLKLDGATAAGSDFVQVFFEGTDAVSCDDGSSLDYSQIGVGEVATATLSTSPAVTDAEWPQAQASEVTIECPERPVDGGRSVEGS